MGILLPEQNYSLEELNSTIYTAVKGYIENIRLLKIPNTRALRYGEGDKLIVPFPTYNQFDFDWTWNKDYHNDDRKIKVGDDLTLQLYMSINQFIEGLRVDFILQVFISATKVRESKKINGLGYTFKTISEIHSRTQFVARIEKRTGLYASDFLTWSTFGKSKIYSYEDIQVQQDKFTFMSSSLYDVYYIPRRQVKGIDVTEDTKLGFSKDTPITLIPIDSISPAFKSFIKKMKRN